MIHVKYTPSHASGTYDMHITEAQWDALKDNPDYQQVTEESAEPVDVIEVDGKEYIPAPTADVVPEPPPAVTAEVRATES